MRRLFLAVIAVLVAGACNNGSGDDSQGDRLNPQEGEVFLEAVDTIGPHPFTSSVALAAVPPVRQTAAAGGSSRQGLRSISGTTSGLFAGSPSLALCDAASAFEDLVAHEDKSQAWVDGLNEDAALAWSGGAKLAVDDLAVYANELTAVVLQADTRVTNHAYQGGRDRAFQAVLQRGTAVLIDTTGVPRVRCASFSPLTPPRPASSPNYRGEQWENFDETKLVVVTAGGTVDSFRVVDIHTRRIVTVPVGPVTGTRATTTSTTLVEETTTTTSRTDRSTTTSIRRAPTTTRPAPATTTTPSTAPPTTTPPTTAPPTTATTAAP